jgi:uncharacterized protein
MKIKKTTLKVAIVVIILLILAWYFFLHSSPKQVYKMNGNFLEYSQHRPKPQYALELNSTLNSIEIYKITFASRNFLEYNTTIAALLFVPKDKSNLPGVVLLPGGGQTKENSASLAQFIAELGFAVLVLDQRGVGETGGYYLPLEQDFQLFAQGKEPVQHLSVYDALAAFDVLAAQKQLNKKNIAILGESMGGRYAIIAASLEPKFKSAFIISASGFHTTYSSQLPQKANTFLYSIDPDQYVSKISPRKIIFFQSNNESVTKIQDAQATYQLAKEPKQFYTYENSSHGFIEQMKPDLEKELSAIKQSA